MLLLEEIVSASNADLINGDLKKRITGYSIDSRCIKEGDFFVPFIGENVDAHKYILESIKKGISGFFVQEGYEDIVKEAININTDICIVKVKDNTRAFINIAEYNRKKYIDIPIVAVTGSVGKTSTKEMIASILEEKYKKVLKTEKNYNSEIGIPYMLLKLEDQDIAVLEAGIGKENEMETLSYMLKPDISVITNIGVSHAEFLKTKENTLKEKFKITKFAKKNIVILNKDDDTIKNINNIVDTSNFEIIYFSEEDIEDIDIKDITKYKTKIYNNKDEVIIYAKGLQNIINSKAAIKVSEKLNIEKEYILQGIKNYKNYSRRFEEIKLRNNISLIDDAYNASYDSLISGLKSFKKMQSNNKIIVLGDVFELGENSKNIHKQIVDLVNTYASDIDNTILIGENLSFAYNNLNESNTKIKVFNNIEEATMFLKSILKENTTVYFKASNGMKFEKIVTELKNIY